MKYGIENLKTVGGFVISLIERGEEVTAVDSPQGSKVTTGEILGSIPKLLGQVVGLIRAVPRLKEEATDIDADEATELKEWFVKEFNLRSDVAEMLVEEVVKIIISLAAIKKAKRLGVA